MELIFPQTVYNCTKTYGAEQTRYPITTTIVNLTVLTLALEMVRMECDLGHWTTTDDDGVYPGDGLWLMKEDVEAAAPDGRPRSWSKSSGRLGLGEVEFKGRREEKEEEDLKYNSFVYTTVH